MAEKGSLKRLYGEGSVFQDSKGYWVYKFPPSPDTNNKEKRIAAKTKSELTKKVNDFKQSIGNANYISDNNTIDNLMGYWLHNVKFNELKPSSYDRLESTIMTHIIPRIGNYKIEELTPEIIEINIFNELKKDNLSYSTVKKVYDALNGYFTFYDKRNRTNFNPMYTVARPKSDNYKKSTIRWFTEDEIKTFKETCISKYGNGEYKYLYGYIFILMLYTGIRAGEALQLKWEDIDTKKKLLYVKGNRITVKNRDANGNATNYKTIDQDTAKTNAGTLRQIPLNDNAIKVINNIKEVYKSKGVKSQLNYVVSSKEGNPITLPTFMKSYKRVLEQSGIDDNGCGLHALRHTFASMLIKNGVDIKIISEILGHSNISITYNTYIHLIKEQKVQAISLIDF